MTIQKKLYIALISVCLTILLVSIWETYRNERALVEDLVKVQLRSTADGYFDAINTMMISGAMANRGMLQEKLLQQEGIQEARIIRAPRVASLFGPGNEDQQAKDEADRRALQGESILELQELDSGRVLTLARPVIASADYRGTSCLACHQAQEGEILGVIKLKYSMQRIDDQIQANLRSMAIFQFLIILTGFVIIDQIFRRLVLKRLRRLSSTLRSLESDTDLRCDLSDRSGDEIGSVIRSLGGVLKKFRTSLSGIAHSSRELIASSNQVLEISNTADSLSRQQIDESNAVAESIRELGQSSSEIKNATHMAAISTDQTNTIAMENSRLATRVCQRIADLQNVIQQSSLTINRLNDKTHEVGSVLEVIQNIAEQTNLLALNAAIEAARAGETGRGFAVVADEVRTLANRTHESTLEIRQTIEQLQGEAAEAVQAMESSHTSAEQRAEDVQQVAASLEDIAARIEEINRLNSGIASSTDEQSSSVDEITQNLETMRHIAGATASDAESGKTISAVLVKLAEKLDEQICQFKL